MIPRTLRALSIPGIIVVIGSLGFAQRNALKIDTPLNDTIVWNPLVEISGEAKPGAMVELRIGSVSKPVHADKDNGSWKGSLQVPAAAGAYVLEVSSGNEAQRIMLTTPRNSHGFFAAHNNPQEIVFAWDKEAEEEIKAIFVATLNHGTLPNNFTPVIDDVKKEAVATFGEAYDGLRIKLVSKPTPGAPVQVVHFVKNDGTELLGETYVPLPGTSATLPINCGNRFSDPVINVYISSFHRLMSDNFDSAIPILSWKPMDRGDTIDVRIKDIGIALGRTAAHEVGHGIGLVGEKGGPADCGWMNGCQGSHSCQDWQDQNPLADRCRDGRYIMEPGAVGYNWIFIGEDGPKRSQRRTVPEFCNFDRSYLRFIQP
jgi:hypothetical protein